MAFTSGQFYAWEGSQGGRRRATQNDMPEATIGLGPLLQPQFRDEHLPTTRARHAHLQDGGDSAASNSSRPWHSCSFFGVGFEPSIVVERCSNPALREPVMHQFPIRQDASSGLAQGCSGLSKESMLHSKLRPDSTVGMHGLSASLYACCAVRASFPASGLLFCFLPFWPSFSARRSSTSIPLTPGSRPCN